MKGIGEPGEPFQVQVRREGEAGPTVEAPGWKAPALEGRSELRR